MYKRKLGLALMSLQIILLAVASANRPVGGKWDIRNGPNRRMAVQWFAGESVQVDLLPVAGREAYDLSGSTLMLDVTDWDVENVYLSATGTVSGTTASWTLSPEIANLPDGNYNGFARTLQDDGGQVVLAYLNVTVKWSPPSDALNVVQPMPLMFYTTNQLIAATNQFVQLSDLSNYATDTELTTAITAATSQLVSSSDLDAATVDLATQADLSAATADLVTPADLDSATAALATKAELIAATADLVTPADLDSATAALATKAELIAATENTPSAAPLAELVFANGWVIKTTVDGVEISDGIITYSTFPAPVVYEPTTTYLPEFSAFNPPVDEAPPEIAASAPEISEWTRAGKSGDAIMLTAEAIDDNSFFVLSSGTVTTGVTYRVEGRAAAFEIPQSMPDNDLYLAWSINSFGFSKAIRINAPECWWIGPNRINPGEKFSVFGRNLTIGDGTAYCYVKNVGWLTSTNANPYKAEFVIPADAAPGAYEIYAHNGKGLKYGWSKPANLTIEPTIVWGNVYNVTDYGASALDDGGDDTAGILEAIELANGNHGEVYFPAGTYAVNQSFRGYANIKIKGDGSASTFYKLHPNYTNSIDTLRRGMFTEIQGDFSFEGITLELNEIIDYFASGYGTPIHYDGWFNVQPQERLSFDDLVIDARSIASIDGLPRAYDNFAGVGIANTRDVCSISFNNCKFIGCLNQISGTEDSAIIYNNCHFVGMWDSIYSVRMQGQVKGGIAFSECTASALDPLGTSTESRERAHGRWIFGNCGAGSIQNFYLGNSSSTNMGPRVGGPMNTGEQIMMEFCTTLFEENPVSASTSNSLNITDSLGLDYEKYVAVIIDGRGHGQARNIIADDGSGGLTVYPSWNVPPDTGSVVQVGTYLKNMALYSNHLDGNTPEGNSTAGFEPYGSLYNSVVDGNTFSDMSSGAILWGMYKDGFNSGCYFNHIANNTATNCEIAYSERYDTWTRSGTPPSTNDVQLCNVFRDNESINCGIGVMVKNDDETQLIATLGISVFERMVMTGVGTNFYYSAGGYHMFEAPFNEENNPGVMAARTIELNTITQAYIPPALPALDNAYDQYLVDLWESDPAGTAAIDAGVSNYSYAAYYAHEGLSLNRTITDGGLDPTLELPEDWLNLGPEMVVNGSFDSTNNWDLVGTAELEIVDSQGVFSRVSYADRIKQEISGFVVGDKYLANVYLFGPYDRSNINAGGYDGTGIVWEGTTYNPIYTATDETRFAVITASGTATLTIDNFTIKKILPED